MAVHIQRNYNLKPQHTDDSPIKIVEVHNDSVSLHGRFQIDNLSTFPADPLWRDARRLAILGEKGAHHSIFRDNHKVKNKFFSFVQPRDKRDRLFLSIQSSSPRRGVTMQEG